MEKYSAELAERTDYESDAYSKLIQRLNEATDRFHLLGGQNMQEEAEKVLKGLGFEPAEFERPLSTFSGGLADARGTGEDTTQKTGCYPSR